MKILIDARLSPDVNGGIQQAIIGLVESMKYSEIDGLEFYFLLYEGSEQWLSPYISDLNKIVFTEYPKSKFTIFQRLLSIIRKHKVGDIALHLLRLAKPFAFRVTEEPTIVKSLNPDVIHFAIQNGFKTKRPNIYQPHDLQHLTLPSYFSRESLLARSKIYGEMIEQATIVVVGNEWTKADVIKAYPDAAKKIKNVPVMPQLSPIRNLGSARKTGRFNLIYPASYWVHKNHKNLFHAISTLKSLNYDVHLTCTGARLHNNPTLIDIIESLGISKSVSLMGFVTRPELDELYAASDLLVMPSFFESESLPIWEAFSYGIPVAASNITAIPSQIDGAGILFDPNSPNDIAQAILQIISNKDLAFELSQKGMARISKLTHQNTISGYRTYYKLATGSILDAHDTEWLKNGFVF